MKSISTHTNSRLCEWAPMSKEMYLQSFSLKRKKILTRQDLLVSAPSRIAIFYSTLWKLYSCLTFKAFYEPSPHKKIMSSSGNAECLSLSVEEQSCVLVCEELETHE